MALALSVEPPKSVERARLACVEIGRVGPLPMGIMPSSPDHDVVERGSHEQAGDAKGGDQKLRHAWPRLHAMRQVAGLTILGKIGC
jgi:hypothetical protein